MKGLSHTYARIHSPPNPPPIQAATQHQAESPVLYSMTLLVICFKYCSFVVVVVVVVVDIVLLGGLSQSVFRDSLHSY